MVVPIHCVRIAKWVNFQICCELNETCPDSSKNEILNLIAPVEIKIARLERLQRPRWLSTYVIWRQAFVL